MTANLPRQFTPASPEELSATVASLYQAKERYNVVYGPCPADEQEAVISLGKLNRTGPLQKTRSCLIFQCSAPAGGITRELENTGYNRLPFSEYPPDFPVGSLFTHLNIFPSVQIYQIKAVLPDGRMVVLGSRAFTSVAGYNALELFLGTRNTLGIPVEYAIKLAPADAGGHVTDRMADRQVWGKAPMTEEERKIVLLMKGMYDPVNLLNTREI
jgi:hypothetical protein